MSKYISPPLINRTLLNYIYLSFQLRILISNKSTTSLSTSTLDQHFTRYIDSTRTAIRNKEHLSSPEAISVVAQNTQTAREVSFTQQILHT